MRIRKSASRVLGSAYYNAQPEAAPPTQLPPQLPPAPSAYGAANGGGRAATFSEGVCKLNRVPWELRSELDVPNPQEDLENYFRYATSRLGLDLSSVLVLNLEEDEKVEGEDKIRKKLMNKQNVAKKMNQDVEKKTVNVKAKKELEKGKAKVEETKIKEEEASDGEQANVWYCKKNDGKRWHCSNIVKMHNTLCDYHFAQSRSYYTPVGNRVAAVAAASASTPASSKPAPAKASASSMSAPASAASSNKEASSAKALTISKHRRKKKAANVGSGEGYIDIYAEFAYYTPWGPFRGKQRGNRSSTKKDIEATADLKEERSQEDKATPEARSEKDDDDDGESDLSDIAEVAGGDEGSDEDYVASAKAVARNRKGKISIQKAKKRTRSLRSLL